MSHVAHVHESCHTHMNESCHTHYCLSPEGFGDEHVRASDSAIPPMHTYSSVCLSVYGLSGLFCRCTGLFCRCAGLQCVAKCYSVLQCVTVCCSVLQCVCTHKGYQGSFADVQGSCVDILTCKGFVCRRSVRVGFSYSSTLQHTATHCNTLWASSTAVPPLHTNPSVCSRM